MRRRTFVAFEPIGLAVGRATEELASYESVL